MGPFEVKSQGDLSQTDMQKMETKKDVFEVDTLLQALEHQGQNEEPLSRDLNKLGEQQDSICYRENLNIKGEDKVCNKTLNFESEWEDIAKKCLRRLLLNADAKHNCCAELNREHTQEGNFEILRDLLRKRGKEKSAIQLQRPTSSPYATTQTEQRQITNLVHYLLDPNENTWSSILEDVGFAGYYDPNELLNDIFEMTCQSPNSDLSSVHIPESTISLATPADFSPQSCLADFSPQSCSGDFSPRSCASTESGDMFQSPNHISSPVYIPNSPQFAVPSDFSPQSTESGYTSDCPDSKSMSNSPTFPHNESHVESYLVPPAFESHTSGLSFVRYPYIPVSDGYIQQTPVSADSAKDKPLKKRNEFFDEVDPRARDRCRRRIRSKEKSESGLDEKDSQGRSILHVAIETNDEIYALTFISVVIKSFESDTRRKGLEHYTTAASFFGQTDVYGHTPLLLACEKNMSRVVKYLLQCGASGTWGSQGSVLHYVCQRGKRLLEVAKVLCCSSRSKEFLGSRNSCQETPLHVAVSIHNSVHLDEQNQLQELVDNRAIVSLLLEKGADLCACNGRSQTALHLAVLHHNGDLIDCLHQSAYRESWLRAIGMLDAAGMSVLHRAVLCSTLSVPDHRKLIERLIAMEASPTVKDSRGKLPKDYVTHERRELLLALDVGYYNALMASANK